ncbi:hypothetical protein ACFQPG_11005 [Sphingomonas sp. GCM10030256]|uniref:hypothetical protein n=1 Tax=Sphingomonas sp. GCM10030256 TaxID=3273427 RepID=UPI0036209EC1
MAIWIAFSFRFCLAFAIPYAPPKATNGSATSVAPATAIPPYRPAPLAAALPTASVVAPAAAPAAPDANLPVVVSFPPANSVPHSATAASNAIRSEGGAANTGENVRGFDEQPAKSETAATASAKFRAMFPPFQRRSRATLLICRSTRRVKLMMFLALQAG